MLRGGMQGAVGATCACQCATKVTPENSSRPLLSALPLAVQKKELARAEGAKGLTVKKGEMIKVCLWEVDREGTARVTQSAILGVRTPHHAWHSWGIGASCANPVCAQPLIRR